MMHKKRFKVIFTLILFSANMLSSTFSLCAQHSKNTDSKKATHCGMSANSEMSCCSAASNESNTTNENETTNTSCSILCNCDLAADLPKQAVILNSVEHETMMPLNTSIYDVSFWEIEFGKQIQSKSLEISESSIPIFIRVLALRN
jgi:hypothetical protein